MFFKQIYDNDLAQASYLIGCQANGSAIVIDPRRDIQTYLETAASEGLTITAVSETHVHADYLSGARELANATGATLYLSDEGGPEWQYGFDHTGLRNGSQIRLGNLTITAVHTPGHTPEHLSFLITDGASANEPGFFLTGDFVFVGDIGRPDLIDETAGGTDTRFVGAKQLFSSLKEKFLTLPDYVQVWPGHGAGSACGKALGAVASSTVGYERRFAWWATYLEHNDEAGFTQALLEGQPDAPTYFARMKHQNKTGPDLLGKRESLAHLTPADLKHTLENGAILIDTRAREAFQTASPPGSIHLPNSKNFATWAGWLLQPEREYVLLAENLEMAKYLRDQLARVGIDQIVGFTITLDGLKLESKAPITLEQFHALKNPVVLDVRTTSEYAAGHLPNATHIHAGRLLANLEGIPRDRPVVVHCQSGARSAAAVSVLRANGFENMLDLGGSYEAWIAKSMVTA
jgi:hydroxyacylglutathione hydrolase